MPRISTFFGINIYLYFADINRHAAPHFHAKYGGDEAVYSFECMEKHSSPPTLPVLPMLPRIVSVKADPETWTILATFATGEKRSYPMAPLLTRGVFRRIAEPEAFVAVRPDEMGGVYWEAGPDLSRDTVYLAGECV